MTMRCVRKWIGDGSMSFITASIRFLSSLPDDGQPITAAFETADSSAAVGGLDVPHQAVLDRRGGAGDGVGLAVELRGAGEHRRVGVGLVLVQACRRLTERDLAAEVAAPRPLVGFPRAAACRRTMPSRTPAS